MAEHGRVQPSRQNHRDNKKHGGIAQLRRTRGGWSWVNVRSHALYVYYTHRDKYRDAREPFDRIGTTSERDERAPRRVTACAVFCDERSSPAAADPRIYIRLDNIIARAIIIQQSLSRYVVFLLFYATIQLLSRSLLFTSYIVFTMLYQITRYRATYNRVHDSASKSLSRDVRRLSCCSWLARVCSPYRHIVISAKDIDF